MNAPTANTSVNAIVPAEVEISHDQVLDFGFVTLPRSPAASVTPHFKPALYAYPDNFNGVLYAGQTKRYVLELRADELRMPCLATFEVFWDGQGTYDGEPMAPHLIVRRLGTTHSVEKSFDS